MVSMFSDRFWCGVVACSSVSRLHFYGRLARYRSHAFDVSDPEAAKDALPLLPLLGSRRYVAIPAF
jgi:hypothetical protein